MENLNEVMPSDKWEVHLRGAKVFESENQVDCLGYVLKAQPQSANYAYEHEGYALTYNGRLVEGSNENVARMGTSINS